jgi:hypothetical protein
LESGDWVLSIHGERTASLVDMQADEQRDVRQDGCQCVQAAERLFRLLQEASKPAHPEVQINLCHGNETIPSSGGPRLNLPGFRFHNGRAALVMVSTGGIYQERDLTVSP